MKNKFFLLLVAFSLCLGLNSQDLEIDTLLNNGIKDNRINFAFANVNHATANAYTEKSDFISDLADILARFDTSPLGVGCAYVFTLPNSKYLYFTKI